MLQCYIGTIKTTHENVMLYKVPSQDGTCYSNNKITIKPHWKWVAENACS